MKSVNFLFWLIALAGMYFDAAYAIDTPDFVLERGRWEQVVVPADSSNLSVRELFADDLPAEGYGSLWVIYYYDADQYVSPGIDGVIPTGTGFWIIQVTGSAITLDLPATVQHPDTTSDEDCATQMCINTPLFTTPGQSSYTMLGPALASTSYVDQVRLSVSTNNATCLSGCTLEEAVELQYLAAPLWHYDSDSNGYVDLSIVGRFEPWQAAWLQTRPALEGDAEVLFPFFSTAPNVSSERAHASRFLAQTTFGPTTDSINALFNHPNVGPFIGTQLIQRLVTSNPSRAYVSRVSAAFNNNGEGVRGDLRAVVRAILLDPEARNVNRTALPTVGRIREPILRLTHWMRSFDAEPDNGRYVLLGTDDPATNIGMTVLRSPSVFNFYRPGYVPPNTPIADAGLVSPEMQITHETSVAGYLNSMLNAVELGTGSNNAIASNYTEAVALGSDPQLLVDYLNVLLMHGSMSGRLQSWLLEAIQTIDVDSSTDQSLALLQRVRLAVYLTMASPEYIVLK